ncbi:MAG: hypothetical protein J0G32_01760 [Alphaproteobacteria bacterium]|nr:hypothetical protein [Alphaproteobacteria bacterium]
MFKYKIEDREYTAKEVYNIINTKPFFSYIRPFSLDVSKSGHLAVSNGDIAYSAGTFVEGMTSIVVKAGLIGCAVGSFFITPALSLGLVAAGAWCAISNSKRNSNNIVDMDDLDECYSGTELTKFFNEYYASNRTEEQRDKVLKKFLDHKYCDAHVTLDEKSSFFDWDYAVLKQTTKEDTHHEHHHNPHHHDPHHHHHGETIEGTDIIAVPSEYLA